MTITKEVEFWEDTVKFLIRKDNEEGLTKEEIYTNVERGVGANDMNGIPAENINITVK